MKKILIAFILYLSLPFDASAFPFTLFTKETTKEGPVLLITSGIHGDEPGAFTAAGIFIDKYTITSGRVWTVPNLNFPSILLSSRGIAGDMNRKFLITNAKDPDYSNLQNIKELINRPEVDFVYGMHDGTGFYRPKYISEMYSPHRWGQCVVIDQKVIPENIPYANTQLIAEEITKSINEKLILKKEKYYIRNTDTKNGNNPMEQSLTWYAVQNKKASLTTEVSKNIPLYKGVYYHLLAIEALLEYKGIKFTRSFPLTPEGVKNVLYDINVKLFNSYTLPIENIRPKLNYMPFEKAQVEFTTSNPLLFIYRKQNAYAVQYGNKILTTIMPEFRIFSRELPNVEVIVDSKKQTVSMGTIFSVKKHFKIPTIEGYRLNIIGYVNKKKKNEFDDLIKRKQILSSFSMDTTEKIYRIELYKEDSFAGMIYAKFS